MNPNDPTQPAGQPNPDAAPPPQGESIPVRSEPAEPSTPPQPDVAAVTQQSTPPAEPVQVEQPMTEQAQQTPTQPQPPVASPLQPTAQPQTPAPQQPMPQQAMPGQQPVNMPNSGGKGKMIVIIVAVALVAVGAIISAVLFLFGDSYATAEGRGDLEGYTIDYPSNYIYDEEESDNVFLSPDVVIPECEGNEDLDGGRRLVGIMDISNVYGTSSIEEIEKLFETLDEGATITVEDIEGGKMITVVGTETGEYCNGEFIDVQLNIVFAILEGKDGELWAGVAGTPYGVDEDDPGVGSDQTYAREMAMRFKANNPELFE